MRMCVACHEIKPKRELQRIVKSPDGIISTDTAGKKPGRGAYVCKNSECLKKARKSKALERKFEASISDEVYAQLESEFALIEKAQTDYAGSKA